MDTSSVILTIMLGILSSLVASVFYLFAFSTIRPKISISPKIAKSLDKDGNAAYKIKILNKGARPIVNIKARLSISEPTIVPGGRILASKTVHLRREEIMSIEGFDARDKDANYAFRFTTLDNLETQWSDDSNTYVIFSIYAVHSLSGLGKLFTQRYAIKRDSIVNGDFVFGNSFEIR
jgi:hypothetical protein